MWEHLSVIRNLPVARRVVVNYSRVTFFSRESLHINKLPTLQTDPLKLRKQFTFHQTGTSNVLLNQETVSLCRSVHTRYCSFMTVECTLFWTNNLFQKKLTLRSMRFFWVAATFKDWNQSFRYRGRIPTHVFKNMTQMHGSHRKWIPPSEIPALVAPPRHR